MDPGPINFLKFTIDSQRRFSQGWPKSVPEHRIIYLLTLNTPYSPDLVTSDFFLFLRLKEVMKGHHLGTIMGIKADSSCVLKEILMDNYLVCTSASVLLGTTLKGFTLMLMKIKIQYFLNHMVANFMVRLHIPCIWLFRLSVWPFRLSVWLARLSVWLSRLSACLSRGFWVSKVYILVSRQSVWLLSLRVSKLFWVSSCLRLV